MDIRLVRGRRGRLFPCLPTLLFTGCCGLFSGGDAPEWRSAGVFPVPYEGAFNKCRETLKTEGFEIEYASRTGGEIRTDWKVYTSDARGFLRCEAVWLKVVRRPADVSEVYIKAMIKSNEDPGKRGSSSDPLWGLEEASPDLEGRIKILLRAHLK